MLAFTHDVLTRTCVFACTCTRGGGNSGKFRFLCKAANNGVGRYLRALRYKWTFACGTRGRGRPARRARRGPLAVPPEGGAGAAYLGRLLVTHYCGWPIGHAGCRTIILDTEMPVPADITHMTEALRRRIDWQEREALVGTVKPGRQRGIQDVTSRKSRWVGTINLRRPAAGERPTAANGATSFHTRLSTISRSDGATAAGRSSVRAVSHRAES